MRRVYRRRSFVRTTRSATHGHAACSRCDVSLWAPLAETSPLCETCRLAAAGIVGRGVMPSGRRPSVSQDGCGTVRQECCGQTCSDIGRDGRAMWHHQNDLNADGLCDFCAAPGAVVRLGGGQSSRFAKLYQNTVRYHGFSPALVVDLDEDGKVTVTETDQNTGHKRCLRVYPDATPAWGTGWTVGGREFLSNWDSSD